MKRSFLAVFFTIMIVSSANAQSTLALQEKCAEGAKKFFFEHIQEVGGKWGSFKDDKGNTWFNNFESHYNKKLDKCFIRIDFSYLPKDWEKEEATNSTLVFNVFDGREIADFCSSNKKGEQGLNFSCSYLGKWRFGESCKRWEFDNFIGPYMND